MAKFDSPLKKEFPATGAFWKEALPAAYGYTRVMARKTIDSV